MNSAQAVLCMTKTNNEIALCMYMYVHFTFSAGIQASTDESLTGLSGLKNNQIKIPKYNNNFLRMDLVFI